MLSRTRPLAAIALALGFTAACGGKTHDDSVIGGSGSSRGCTPLPGLTPDPYNDPNVTDSDCRGEILCGVGPFCMTPQRCCIRGAPTADVDPASCPCGVTQEVVGTHCAPSCTTTPQQCYEDPGGRNSDCPSGQACMGGTLVAVNNVAIVLTTCSPAGVPLASGGGVGSDGTGACVDPGDSCAGSVVECSSALSCALGNLCCQTQVTVCADCPVTSSGDSSG
jgi:hypothetical protein